MQQMDTDYLVIGSGTAGLAFVDTLLAEDDAHITIVDRHGKPGGHWNDAYPFVTLHQPSAFYGVNSMVLGSGRKDTHGLNAGLYELACGPDISGYFDRVMNHRLLPSGRVSYLPLSNHLGDGRVESLLSGRQTQINVRRKTVDARYYSPPVPSTHVPRFSVAEGVDLVPPNALPGLWARAQGPQARPLPRRFVVLGAGKTAMDVCIWLLQSGADPDSIQWVVPRDSWLINRVTTQNGPEFFHEAIGGQVRQMTALAEARSVEDLFLRLEACGTLLRIDPSRMPGMFHLATVSEREVAELRRVHQVIRQGRVQALEPTRMVMDRAVWRWSRARSSSIARPRRWSRGPLCPSSKASRSCCRWCVCLSRPSALPSRPTWKRTTTATPRRTACVVPSPSRTPWPTTPRA
jgi:hypothetical protein